MSLEMILSNFAPCFTAPGYRNFVDLALGWILCPGRHAISRVILAASIHNQNKHHSSFYRFLAEGRWAVDSIGKVIFFLLLILLPAIITAIVDDTLCKKTGPHLFGAGMHHDASASTYGRKTKAGRKTSFAFGHNWVVLAIWIPLPWGTNRGMAIPILFRLYRSKKRCPTEIYRKRTELAAELVKILATWIPVDRKLVLVGDGEYACKTLVRHRPPGLVFIGPMLMGAALYDTPGTYQGKGRKRSKGNKLPSPKQLAARDAIPWEKKTLRIYGKEVTILVKSQVCLWYTVAGKQLVRMVVTRDPQGHIDDRAYFCTDPNESIEQILVQFARRWEIEVAFRNTKQIMGIDDPQNGWWRRKPTDPKPKKQPGPNAHPSKGENAIVRTFSLALVSYALVVLWYLNHGDYKKDVERVRLEAPWYRHKQYPSFLDMVSALRREIWLHRLSTHPLLERVPKKIFDLIPHWFLAAA